MSYLQQVSGTLEREKAHPETVRQDWLDNGAQWTLNINEANRRGHRIRALYWRFRVWIWDKQAGVIERKREQIEKLQKRRGLTARRAGVSLRSGRY